LTIRVPSAALALTALLILGLIAIPVTAAEGAQTATISAKLSPLRLGAPTTVSFGFQIQAAGGGLPAALTGIDFRYPPQLGLGTSELGLAACDPAKLSYYGPRACPSNSIMGSGSALAKFQVSPEVSEESASLALVAGPSQNGYLKLLISATGAYPVATRIIMDTLLLPGQLRISVPLVPGVPEGPDVAVVAIHATLGGNLTYYERKHGKRIAYHPRGIQLPKRCPRGGFRFSATFTFLDGTQTQAATVVKCPL
jgi:hypothetical protein